MVAPAEERPPRVDAGPCGATHLAWIGRYEVAALSLVAAAEPVSMVVLRSPRWRTGSLAADLASQRADPDSS
jgi:hypothetical protein